MAKPFNTYSGPCPCQCHNDNKSEREMIQSATAEVNQVSTMITRFRLNTACNCPSQSNAKIMKLFLGVEVNQLCYRRKQRKRACQETVALMSALFIPPPPPCCWPTELKPPACRCLEKSKLIFYFVLQILFTLSLVFSSSTDIGTCMTSYFVHR